MEGMPEGMLAESVSRTLADVVTTRGTVEAEAHGLDEAAWQALRDLGLAGEDAASLQPEEQAAVVEAVAYAGALAPYADSEALARFVAQSAGIETDVSETLALALAGPDALSGYRIPWGRHSARTVLAFEEAGRHFVAIVPTAELRLVEGANLAGEPSDKCGVERLAARDRREVAPALSAAGIRRRGALYRSAAMLGAATRANELTLRYAADRKQFGKPLAQFQVIQAYLAQMAGELYAARAILATALRAGEGGMLETAAAKVRIGQAAQVVAALAHQVHGAIGFTQEYSLHLWTRRMWAWREEFGNESDWARELGSAAIALGPDGYWERMTQ